MVKEKTKTGKQLMRFRRQWELQVFALSGVAYLIIFSIIPMFGIILAFKAYKITSGIGGFFTSEWVGLKYFREFFLIIVLTNC